MILARGSLGGMPSHPCSAGRRVWLRCALALSIFAATVSLRSATPTGDAATPSFKRGVSIGNWMAKMRRGQPFGGSWFYPDDLAWIAQQGFDHVRIPVDGRLLVREDTSLDEEKILRFLEGAKWARGNGLNVVLDLHFLPGGEAPYDANAQDPAIFTDEKARANAAQFWGKLAQRLKGEGAWLRFELLNEPFAPRSEQLNALNRVLIAAVRAVDTERVLYVTSNLSSTFATLEDVAVPADPRVALLLHYDEPMIFTHQRASWKQLPATMPPVPFPGRVPDLAKLVPADHWAAKVSSTEMTVEEIDAAFAKAAAWIATHAPGKEVYLGGFGCYETAPAESRRAWIAAVRGAAERHGWGWAVWDYRGSFGVRAADGKATAVLEGLFKR